MDKLSIENDPGCVDAATSILGDKWTPKILRVLAQKKLVRFCELQDLSGGVNPRTLSARLSTLEELDIISKTIFAEVPPRCEYALTKKGHDLLPVLKSMAEWGRKYSEKTKAPLQ